MVLPGDDFRWAGKEHPWEDQSLTCRVKGVPGRIKRFWNSVTQPTYEQMPGATERPGTRCAPAVPSVEETYFLTRAGAGVTPPRRLAPRAATPAANIPMPTTPRATRASVPLLTSLS